LEARAAKDDLKGRVHFLGERSNVPELLRGMNVYVNSSIAEGISNTILEAMATGLPVVATRAGGNVELVDHQVTGLLVPVGNVQELASALLLYFNDPALSVRHGAAGRQRAVDRFSIGKMGAQYKQLYLSLLQGTGSRDR
jgi:glycosyltransferase involved in cell wall biosynthesis